MRIIPSRSRRLATMALCGAATASACLLSVSSLASPQRVTADRPEPGLQGQTLPQDLKTPVLPVPYSKGVRIVGQTSLGNRGTNLQMAWVDDCAYVSSSVAIPGLPVEEARAKDPAFGGVAVIDVRDPTKPQQVATLRDKASILAVETMHAVSAPGRKVLAAGAYEANVADKKPWLDIYDVSSCRKPKLMSEFVWPETVHEVTVSPNGKRVYGTVIHPFAGTGGILVLDISDMAHPRYLGKFGVSRPDGTAYEFATHEISISPDEKRIYAGVIASRGGDLNRTLTKKGPSAEGLGPEAGGIYILDNSDIAAGRPDPKMRLIGTVEHGGWHSVVQARIGGRPYLVGAGEIGGCPGAWPRISTIADETKPRIVGEFRLAMNRPENCPARAGIEAATNGIVGQPGTASSHFNDVDDAIDTRLGLFQFSYGGLRIADLRDPAKPTEVAYFKPGDPCISHVRYVRATGHIWFACMLSGFHVIALKDDVRATLGLPRVTATGSKRRN